jgi:hypothetical protein
MQTRRSSAPRGSGLRPRDRLLKNVGWRGHCRFLAETRKRRGRPRHLYESPRRGRWQHAAGRLTLARPVARVDDQHGPALSPAQAEALNRLVRLDLERQPVYEADANPVSRLHSHVGPCLPCLTLDLDQPAGSARFDYDRSLTDEHARSDKRNLSLRPPKTGQDADDRPGRRRDEADTVPGRRQQNEKGKPDEHRKHAILVPENERPEPTSETLQVDCVRAPPRERPASHNQRLSMNVALAPETPISRRTSKRATTLSRSGGTATRSFGGAEIPLSSGFDGTPIIKTIRATAAE